MEKKVERVIFSPVVILEKTRMFGGLLCVEFLEFDNENW